MQKLIEHLIKLQNIDSELQFIRDLRGNLPHQIEMLYKQLKEVENNYNEKKTRLKQIKKEKGLTQVEIEDLIKKKQKYQTQLYEVTNNKEYDAVTSEIDEVDAAINENENKVISLMEEEEILIAELDKHKNELTILKENFKKKELELGQKNAKTEKEELTLNDKKNSLVSNIENKYLSLYDRIRNAKGGLAVVPIQRGSCGGCSKKLPPQKILEIRSMKRLHVCEVCGRILIWDGNKSQDNL